MTVLTGFLGAGKTTLLNRILNGDHGLHAQAFREHLPLQRIHEYNPDKSWTKVTDD